LIRWGDCNREDSLKILDPGHHYQPTHLDGPGMQSLVFVKRIPSEKAHEGVIVQEVIRALIDRVYYVHR
jgi:hypothetical protein